MTPRRANNLLWLTAAALAAASVGVVAWALFVPVDAGASAVVEATTTRPSTKPADMANATMDTAAWSRDLRRPLYDAPPAAPAAPVAAAPLAVKLVGTAVDAGRGQALLILPGGHMRFVDVGETAGGVEVLAVAPGSADVRFNGERVTLSVPGKGATP